jgi:hypothetical protein
MKGIKISTKITLLILVLSLVAVIAISFFTYDYITKNNQEKFSASLNVIADNRAAYFNSQLDKVMIAIQLIQEADAVKGGDSTQTTATETAGLDLVPMDPM